MLKDKVLIVGLPRSGTTTLLRHVEKLLGLKSKPIEEFGFWPKVLKIRLGSAIEAFYKQSPNIRRLFQEDEINKIKNKTFINQYISLLELAFKDDPVAIDKTPSSFEIIDLLQKKEKFKLIIISRDPSSRLISAIASKNKNHNSLVLAYRIGVQEQMLKKFRTNIQRLNNTNVWHVDYDDVVAGNYKNLIGLFKFPNLNNTNIVSNITYGYSSKKHNNYKKIEYLIKSRLHIKYPWLIIFYYLGQVTYICRYKLRRILFRWYSWYT